jgi:hypothetical protein
MTAIARLSYAGGGAVLPAATAYDRELLHDHLLYLVTRRAKLRLELAGRIWWLTPERAPLDCAACNRRLRISVFARPVGVAPRCLRCALALPLELADAPARPDARADRSKSSPKEIHA